MACDLSLSRHADCSAFHLARVEGGPCIEEIMLGFFEFRRCGWKGADEVFLAVDPAKGSGHAQPAIPGPHLRFKGLGFGGLLLFRFV